MIATNQSFITPSEARVISDKAAEPSVKKFWEKNKLEEFFLHGIKEAAENGEYAFDFFINSEQYNVAVLKSLDRTFKELGYQIEFETLENTEVKNMEGKFNGWRVIISWVMWP